jgi:hypothetical protein
MRKLAILLFSVIPLITFCQDGSEVYLFKLSVNNNVVLLSEGKNISDHKGYDNQPSFHPVQPIIYFSSFDDSGRSDIRSFNFVTNKLSNFTLTKAREYSPTVTPDKKFISCIVQRDNGVQDLAKYPAEGGAATVIINDLKVGYHKWLTDHSLLLFVLKNDSTNELHHYDLSTKTDKIIATNPGRSLHNIPGENATSFIQKNKTGDYDLKRFDNATGAITQITTIPRFDDICWISNNLLLLSANNEIRVYQRDTNTWSKATINADASLLKKITRMAVSPAADKIAIVLAE